MGLIKIVGKVINISDKMRFKKENGSTNSIPKKVLELEMRGKQRIFIDVLNSKVKYSEEIGVKIGSIVEVEIIFNAKGDVNRFFNNALAKEIKILNRYGKNNSIRHRN